MNRLKITVKKLQEDLDEYDQKLAIMKIESDEVRSGTKGEYLRQVKSLKRERDNFVLRYGQIHMGDEIKDGTQEAWAALKATFIKVESKFHVKNCK